LLTRVSFDGAKLFYDWEMLTDPSVARDMPSSFNFTRLTRAPILAIVLIVTCLAQSKSSDLPPSSLRLTHDALFASFIPVDQFPSNTERARMFATLREGIWRMAESSPDFQSLLKPFADLGNFGATCGISDYVKSAGNHEFARLASAERQHVLFLLLTCSENEPRRLAMNARNFYLDRTYGAAASDTIALRRGKEGDCLWEWRD
jgi:hypothetical protein